MDKLSTEESGDLIKLINEIKNLIKNIYNEDPIIFMNTHSHSSQEHLHFHILPSKGNLRDLVSNYESVPKEIEKIPSELSIMKEKFLK